MQLLKPELYDFLEEKHRLYNQPNFIEHDPISIPHLFTKKEDIEIAGFFAATIAWGQRSTILKNANKLMDWMDCQPHQFILNHSTADLKFFKTFVHRTFNGIDCVYFIEALKNIYTQHGGIENTFAKHIHTTDTNPSEGINGFRAVFFELANPERTKKHISSPANNSSAKRISMYLRWMVRKDKTGVDFGIWSSIKPAQLTCPLDVHSGRVARRLGLLNRTQNDWKAVIELSETLKTFDAEDPIKYDFALFGLGVNEKF